RESKCAIDPLRPVELPASSRLMAAKGTFVPPNPLPSQQSAVAWAVKPTDFRFCAKVTVVAGGEAPFIFVVHRRVNCRAGLGSLADDPNLLVVGPTKLVT